MAKAQIQNLDRLISKLENVSDDAVKKALNRACLVVENEAKKECPVDDGQLRASITHEVEDKEGYIGTNVEYAPYVEIGTGVFSSKGNGRQDRWSYQDAEGHWHSTIGNKPQPFLLPALENNRNEILEIFQQAINQEVSKNG